ncbi:MAG: sensor histidine kinase [Anaerolineales bacterium]
MLKKFTSLYLPILLVLSFQGILLGWAVQSGGKSLREVATLFSFIVAILIFITGLLPAFVRPQPSHTLVACFAVSFSFFIFLPFDLKDFPFIQPGLPLYHFLDSYLIVRLVSASLLLPMAIHVSARFPRKSDLSAKTIASAYAFSFAILIVFLFSYLAWQRITLLLLFLGWFTFVIVFFFFNLIKIARDTSSENIQDAQRARIILFSIALAEIPLWLRPFTFILGIDIFPYNLLLIFQLFIPFGIAYAVLRHDLFGIDRVLRRTLVYGTVSLLLLTLYLALTTGMTELFAGSLVSRPLAPVVSLFVSAVLFEPTRRLVQAWLDKILYPDHLKFQSAVVEMQALLVRTNRREEIIRLLTEVFPKQIGAEWGSLKLFPEPDVPPANLEPAWNARLLAGNVSVGGYWLGPRRTGPLYDVEERVRLNAMASQAALALAYSNAYEALYELNQNLEERVREQAQQTVADQKSIAAFEERQKIARDLHDSVSQGLFGMHLMARGLAANSTPEMKDDLQALELQARETLKEMRLMLSQLRNVSAEENVNLVEAVQNLCDAFARRSGPEGGVLLSITLEMPKEIILSKSIAEEALWVMRESLHNIVKHSNSREALIEIRCDEKLSVVIKDNGNGFDVNSLPAGHYGLRGMRERVLSLGGDFEVESVREIGATIRFSLLLPR